jgi:hypothetical protein
VAFSIVRQDALHLPQTSVEVGQDRLNSGDQQKRMFERTGLKTALRFRVERRTERVDATTGIWEHVYGYDLEVIKPKGEIGEVGCCSTSQA